MGEEGAIRRIVKEIDPRFDCRWEADSEEYVITQTNPLGVVSWFDSVRYDELTRDFFDHIRRVVYINRNGDMARQVLDDQKKHVEMKETKRRDAVHNWVKEDGEKLYYALREA